MAETPRPSPGLSHRQRDRPVRQLSSDPGKAPSSSSSSQSPSQQRPPQSDATPAAQTQSPAFPPQDAAQRPRASLQPLSAIQQKPYVSANSAAPVRHADFAEGQQSTNAVATVQFWLTFHAEFGQRLRVVGSHKNLGMCRRACTKSMYPGTDCLLHWRHKACKFMLLFSCIQHASTCLTKRPSGQS